MSGRLLGMGEWSRSFYLPLRVARYGSISEVAEGRDSSAAYASWTARRTAAPSEGRSAWLAPCISRAASRRTAPSPRGTRSKCARIESETRSASAGWRSSFPSQEVSASRAARRSSVGFAVWSRVGVRPPGGTGAGGRRGADIVSGVVDMSRGVYPENKSGKEKSSSRDGHRGAT